MNPTQQPQQIRLYSEMQNSFPARIKELLLMILPLNGGLILQFLTPLSNIAFAGLFLGKQALAAVALVQSIGFLVLLSFLLGFSSANDTLGSQAYGAQNFEGCAVYFNQTRISTLIISILFFPIYFYCGYILYLIGIDLQISQLFSEYARIYYFANVMYIQGFIATNFLRAQQHVSPTFIGSFITLISHLISIYLLLNHTQLGLLGIALANCISSFVFLAIGYSFLFWGKMIHPQTYRSIKLKDFKNCKSFFKIAIPQCLLELIEGWSFQMTTVIVGKLGNAPLAAQGIISQIAGLLWICSAFGMSGACTTFVGNAIGMGQVNLSKKLAIEIFVISMIIIGTQISVSLLFPRRIISFYIDDQQVIQESLKAYTPMLFGLIFDTANWIAYGILKGLGKVFWIPIIQFIFYYLIHQPVSLIFIFYFGYDYEVYWFLLIVVLSTMALVNFIFVFSYNWNTVSEAVQRRQEKLDVQIVEDNNNNNKFLENNLAEPLLN